MYSILTKAPADVAKGFSLVSFSRKSTKENPVADGDKYRAVVVPSYTLPTVVEAGSWNTDTGEFKGPVVSPDVFAVAIQEVFFAAASSILLDYCKANPATTEISEEMLTFTAVLTRMESQQTSERLNQEQIFTWYDTSETKKQAAIRYTGDAAGLKKQAALRTKFGAVASNNSGISADLATKMISYIAEADTSNSTCAAVVKKLERLTKETVDADEL